MHNRRRVRSSHPVHDGARVLPNVGERAVVPRSGAPHVVTRLGLFQHAPDRQQTRRRLRAEARRRTHLYPVRRTPVKVILNHLAHDVWTDEVARVRSSIRFTVAQPHLWILKPHDARLIARQRFVKVSLANQRRLFHLCEVDAPPRHSRLCRAIADQSDDAHLQPGERASVPPRARRALQRKRPVIDAFARRRILGRELVRREAEEKRDEFERQHPCDGCASSSVSTRFDDAPSVLRERRVAVLRARYERCLLVDA